jgi:hypothetical protein
MASGQCRVWPRSPFKIDYPVQKSTGNNSTDLMVNWRPGIARLTLAHSIPLHKQSASCGVPSSLWQYQSSLTFGSFSTSRVTTVAWSNGHVRVYKPVSCQMSASKVRYRAHRFHVAVLLVQCLEHLRKLLYILNLIGHGFRTRSSGIFSRYSIDYSSLLGKYRVEDAFKQSIVITWTIPYSSIMIAARRSARLVRYLSTETASSHASEPSPPLVQPRPARPQVRSSLTPRKTDPATLTSTNTEIPLRLPKDFGRNQLLSVPNSTRALLEEIVATFNSPIRYAFAYGSGVFEQQGSSLDKNKTPMLDFIFAVSHPEHWHSINLAQNPSHYALHARLLGSDFIGRVQNWGPAAVWFNPFVPVSGVVRDPSAGSINQLLTEL